jgi:uncharacterized damage-inducible protein DinB
MKWYDVVLAGYENVLQTLERALDGLAEDDLNWQPSPDCNSIGWLTWHLTRAQDGLVALLMGEEQLWIRDGWHAKFGRPPDARDSGSGHTPQDVAAFKSPDAKTLLDYHRAVLERSRAYFPTLSETDLDREVNLPWLQPPPGVGVFLILILSDDLQHAGQVAYLRGLRQGLGWQKF